MAEAKPWFRRRPETREQWAFVLDQHMKYLGTAAYYYRVFQSHRCPVSILAWQRQKLEDRFRRVCRIKRRLEPADA